MKKMLFLVALIAVSMTSASAIDIAKGEVFMKCNQETVFNSLVNYLDMDNFQSNEMKVVFSSTEKQIKNAFKADSQDSIDKAVSYNLGSAKKILTKEQYKKFLYIINLSYYNSNIALLAQNN